MGFIATCSSIRQGNEPPDLRGVLSLVLLIRGFRGLPSDSRRSWHPPDYEPPPGDDHPATSKEAKSFSKVRLPLIPSFPLNAGRDLEEQGRHYNRVCASSIISINPRIQRTYKNESPFVKILY